MTAGTLQRRPADGKVQRRASDGKLRRNSAINNQCCCGRACSLCTDTTPLHFTVTFLDTMLCQYCWQYGGPGLTPQPNYVSANSLSLLDGTVVLTQDCGQATPVGVDSAFGCDPCVWWHAEIVNWYGAYAGANPYESCYSNNLTCGNPLDAPPQQQVVYYLDLVGNIFQVWISWDLRPFPSGGLAAGWGHVLFEAPPDISPGLCGQPFVLKNALYPGAPFTPTSPLVACNAATDPCTSWQEQARPYFLWYGQGGTASFTPGP